MNLELRRILAFLVDFLLSALLWTLSLLAFIFLPKMTENFFVTVALKIAVPVLFGAIFVFLFRDAFFLSKTPGKRLFSIRVYDSVNLGIADGKKLFVKNLFTFLAPIDFFLLLFAGRTFAERVSKTVVLHKPIDEAPNVNPTPPPEPCEYKLRKSDKKKLFIVIGTVVLFIALIIGLGCIVLERKKDSQEYKLAYAYLVESDTFSSLNAKESDIWFSGISTSTYTTSTGVSTGTRTLTFNVKWKTYKVVFHDENKKWILCEDCTDFK